MIIYTILLVDGDFDLLFLFLLAGSEVGDRRFVCRLKVYHFDKVCRLPTQGEILNEYAIIDAHVCCLCITPIL